MKLDESYLNIPILIIGLLYIILTNNQTNFYIFSFKSLAVSIAYLIIIFFIIIGLILLFRYSKKKRNNLFIVQIFYWFLVSALILISISVILSPVFLRNDEGWFLFLEFSAIIIGLPSIIFISKINPNVDFNSHNKKQSTRKRKVYKYLVPSVYVLLYLSLYLSTILFWLLFWRIPYGSSEGMSGLLLCTLLRFNIVSFIPICGIIHFLRKETIFKKHSYSRYNLKVILSLAVFTFTGIFSTIGPIISNYMKETRKYLLLQNILFYYVFIIGAVTTLVLLYFVEKHIINIKNLNPSKLIRNERS